MPRKRRADALQPWDRRDNESEPAYAGLRHYLDMGESRTLDKVAEKVGKSGKLMRDWSARYQWVQRAAEFDSHNARVEQEARDKAKAKTIAQWERRQQEDRESLYNLAMALRQKAAQMLRRSIARETVSDDGKTIEVIPAKWTFATAASMAKASAELSQLAIGDALFEDDGFVAGDHTPEECQEYLDKQNTRRKSIREAGGLS